MAMSVRAGQTAVKSEPNVVPMIDIMLVLLIIFMIVTPLIAAGFKATLPEGTLEDQLRSIFAARTEDKILYFKADNQLKFGRIQEAVETARRSGVRVMAAITEPTAQGALFGDAAEKEEN